MRADHARSGIVDLSGSGQWCTHRAVPRNHYVVIDVRVMQCHASMDVVIGVRVMLCHQAIMFHPLL